MKMKAQPHPGEIVGDNLAELGVTIKDAAEALGGHTAATSQGGFPVAAA